MAATRIRWDRLGRWALIAVFAFVLYLYVGPLLSWVSTYKQAGEKRQEVAALKARNTELKDRRKELRDKRALEVRHRRIFPLRRRMVGSLHRMLEV